MTRTNFSIQYLLRVQGDWRNNHIGQDIHESNLAKVSVNPKAQNIQSEPYLSQTQASIVRKQTFQCQQLFGNIWPSVYTSTRWVCIQASGLTFTFMYMYTSNFFLLRRLSCCIGNYYFMNECVDRLEVFSQNPQWDVISIEGFFYSDRMSH